MNERQNFIAALTFQYPERVPFQPGAGRRSTLKAWYEQGLPPEVTDYVGYVCDIIGIERGRPKPEVFSEVNFRMIPEFEEKVIERRKSTLVVQDWKGNICEISDQFDVSYLREAIDFVTRNWIRCPVENRTDWADMARRYNPDDPARYPADFAQRQPELARRNYPSGLIISGPFWQMREWLGFENLCMLFLDDPGFVHEMVEFWEDFVTRVLRRTFTCYIADFITISEDMAYKQKPMIGPQMAQGFLGPCWRKWTNLCREAGVPVIDLDSDGYIGELIPVWIDAGFNATRPMEVAAGNDLPGFRQKFGTKMAYQGGVDKRAMATGGDTLTAEMERLRPAVEAGGYIPGCDHGIPFNVSWPNFVQYCRLLAKMTGWLN